MADMFQSARILRTSEQKALDPVDAENPAKPHDSAFKSKQCSPEGPEVSL